jgi:hypothetical protein
VRGCLHDCTPITLPHPPTPTPFSPTCLATCESVASPIAPRLPVAPAVFSSVVCATYTASFLVCALEVLFAVRQALSSKPSSADDELPEECATEMEVGWVIVSCAAFCAREWQGIAVREIERERVRQRGRDRERETEIEERDEGKVC